MRFIELEMQNFGVISSAKLSFEGRGLVLIDGLNLDSPDRGSNGSGKTSLVPDAISWVLFGKTTKGVTGDRVVRVGSEGGTFVKASIRARDGVYTVIRYRGHPKYQSRLQIFSGAKDLSCSTMKDSEQLLRGLIGADYDAWMYTTILGQGLSYRFSSLRDEQRAQLLESVIGLPDFDHARDVVVEELRETDKKLQGLIGAYDEATRNLKGEHDTLRDLESKLASVPKDAPNAEALAEAEKKLSVYTSRVKPLRESLDGVTKKLDQVDRKITSCRQDVEDLSGRISSAKRTLTTQSQDLDTLSKKACPTCLQDLPDPTYKSLVKTGTQRMQEVRALLALDSNEYASAVERLDRLSTLDRLDLVKDQANARRELSKVEAVIEDCQLEVRRLLKLSNAQGRSSFIEEQIEMSKAAVVKMQARIDELNLKVSSINQDREYTSWWVDGFQRLRLDVLRRSVTFLSSRLSYYCSELSGGTLTASVSLDEKKISSGAGLSVKLLASTLGGTYTESSGGEKDRIDLALAFALHDLALQTLGFSSNILVCDEVGGFIDPPGIGRAVALLKKKAESLDAVFVISQNPTWKHHIDSVLLVKRKGGSSTMVRGKA